MKKNGKTIVILKKKTQNNKMSSTRKRWMEVFRLVYGSNKGEGGI